MAQKDFYNVLGVSEKGDDRRDQEAVSAPGEAASPGLQQGRCEVRRALQGDLRGVPGAGRREAAPAVRRDAPPRRVRRIHVARSARGRRRCPRRGRVARGAPGGPSPGLLRRVRRRRARRTRRPVQLDVRRRRRAARSGRAAPSRGRAWRRRSRFRSARRRSAARCRSNSKLNEECVTCKGSGAAKGAKIQSCPECGGRGTISFGQGGFAVNRPCPMCLGKGTVPSAKCPDVRRRRASSAAARR